MLLTFTRLHGCYDEPQKHSITRHWDNSCSYTSGTSSQIRRRSKLPTIWEKLEDLSIEKPASTRYPHAKAKLVESHKHQGPTCPASESTILTLTTFPFHIVFTDLKVVNTTPILDSTTSCSSQMCIVDIHLSIICVEDKPGSKRVVEEFSLGRKSLWIAQF